MGLDQYVENENEEEISYWRKENALQGWFENKYDFEKCNYKVVLTEEIVNQLLSDLREKKLEPTEGFFYGSQEPLTDVWYVDMTLEWEEILDQIHDDPKSEFAYTCSY